MLVDELLRNNPVTQHKILGVLTSFCMESPVRICFDKLSKSKDQYLSLNEIAWLEAISEMKFDSFCVIRWEDQALLRRLNKLGEYLFHIAPKSNINSGYENSRNEEVKRFKETLNRRFVSSKKAIEYFTALRAINGLATYQEEREELERAKRQLFHYQLAEMNLTTELIKSIRDCCRNKPVALVPLKLPKTVWLKILAHYLAISAKNYHDYVDIEYDDQKLLNNAISIHKLLREKLSEMLGIQLNERSLMSPKHREIADSEGILNIAVVAINSECETPDHWSVEVTQELALRVMGQLPEFSYLFDDKVEAEEYQPSSTALASKPSYGCNYETKALFLAAERVLEKNPGHDLEPKAIWNTLIAKKDDANYKIRSIERHEKKPRSSRIIFNSGCSFDYHAAQAHIKKVIEWFKTTQLKNHNPQ